MSEIALIGVDWGSTSVRAFAIARDGVVADVRRLQDGGVFTGHGDFAARLTALLGDWREWFAGTPILMCGMVGSDRGWVLAPYVPAPAGLDDLAKHLVLIPFDGATARIVPGVSFVAGETCEVMRGEETIVMGLDVEDAIVCLPGTHAKWVEVANGRIGRFRTYMTGELRAQLLSQGALTVDAEQEQCDAALVQGLDAARSGVGNALFQARARRLLGQLPAAWVASFVTGVLVGDELRHEADDGRPLIVVAQGALAQSYGTALTHAGRAHRTEGSEHLAARGLWHIAQAARLL